MKTTGDQQLVKRINRSVLLRLVRAEPGLSRAQLSLRSGLTKSTVGGAVRELIDEGWLAQTAQPASVTAVAGQGRPSTPLQINTRARGLIGIEVGVDCLRVAGVTLLGEVVWSEEEALAARTPVLVCAQVAALASRAHAELSRRGFLLSGVGLGLPGAYEETSGILRFAPNLGWRNLHLAPMIAQAFGAVNLANVPLHIQNEADAAALSEYEFTHSENVDALIFVTCDVGVGAGIVLNDRLYTGTEGLAGEIGHTILQMDGPLCSCGRRGCAEAFIGARALARDVTTPAGLQRAGACLGVLLQNIWTSFNPAVLVLGGKSCTQHPGLVAAAREALALYAASAGMPAPVVRTASYGLFASAVGAAALVLHRYLRPVHLHPLNPLQLQPHPLQLRPAPARARRRPQAGADRHSLALMA